MTSICLDINCVGDDDAFITDIGYGTSSGAGNNCINTNNKNNDIDSKQSSPNS